MSDPITISFTVTNPLHLEGIAYVTELFNSTLPPVVDEATGQSAPATGLTEFEYLQSRAYSMVGSYAEQKVRADWEAGVITKTERDAKLAAIANIQP